MKLRFTTCIMMLTLSANGAAALTSAGTTDPIDADLTGEARAGIPATTSIPLNRTSPSRPTPAVTPRPGANPLWAVPLSALSSTRDRPIFSASRRPPPSAVAPVAAAKVAGAPKSAEPERPQLALVGTIASGEEQFGIFLDQSTATAIRLKIGEDVRGWKLSAVQGREATLEKDQQVVVLTLPQPGAAPPAALAGLNLGPQPIPGQPRLLSAPQPRRRAQPNRQM